MSDDEVDSRLREMDTGVLSLARDGDAYAIPAAYYYDGGSLLLRLGDHPESDKMQYIDSTGNACFVVHEKRGEGDAWSVVVNGPLRRLADEEMAEFTETEINERFPSIWVFDEEIAELVPAIFELPLDDVTGRQTE
ncbi:pyridoxamine 5'-phosphate oxidase family protein [Halobacteriaceae archaeon GCM10025711]